MSAPSAKELAALAAGVTAGMVERGHALDILAAANAWLREETPSLSQWEDERLLRADRVEEAARSLAECLGVEAFRSCGDSIASPGYGDATPSDGGGEINTEYTVYTDGELAEAEAEWEAANAEIERREAALVAQHPGWDAVRVMSNLYVIDPDDGHHRVGIHGDQRLRITGYATGDDGAYGHHSDFEEPDSPVWDWVCQR